jgi:hypothetical protein
MPEVTLCFDKKTHLLVRLAYNQPPLYENGPDPLMEHLYDDYHEFGADEEQFLRARGVKTDAAALLAFLSGHKIDPAVLKRIGTLVKQLGDDSFEVRQQATEGLVALGAVAIPFLQEATRNEDLEVSRRAQGCLERIGNRPDPAPVLAAVCLLALRRPDGAAAALLDLLPGADEVVADDVRAALVALARGPGGPDPVLVRAQDDPDPLRRAAARAVLGKDGGVYLARPGRRLFPTGLRVPGKQTAYCSGVPYDDRRVSGWRFVNHCDDRDFVRPEDAVVPPQ